MSEGVVSLVNQLSELYSSKKVKNQNESTFHGHVFSKTQKDRKKILEKKYRRICFEYILKRKDLAESSSSLTAKDRLYGEALKLSINNDREKSSTLIKLADTLGRDDDGHIDKALQFILALAGSNDRSDSGGCDSSGFIDIGENIERRVNIDQFTVQPYCQSFRFNVNSKKLFSSYSGQLPLYSPQDFRLPVESNGTVLEVDSTDERKTEHVKNVKRLDRGFVPCLGEHSSFKTKIEEEDNKDEGYSSPKPPQQQLDCTGIWESIWKVDVVDRRCWEGLRSATSYWEGLGEQRWQPGTQLGESRPSLPFLSEAGGGSVHHLWQVCMANLQLVDPHLPQPQLTVIPENTLSLHICYLLAGIETESFKVNEQDKFEIKTGLCIDGLSPECVSSVCEEYIKVGDVYRYLNNIDLKDQSPGSRILAGFFQGVHKYLRVYSSAVIYMGSRINHLGQLYQALRPLIDQMEMLGSICKVKEKPLGWVELPRGVDLLSLLLTVSVHICQDQANLTLISLFKDAVNPYFRFLKSWLYSGECDFTCKEFGLLMDTRYISNRGVDYWLYTYGLAQLSDHGPAAAFLSEIQEKVFCTGKSMALLKLICPDHHLCGKYRDLEPEFALAVTAPEQARLRTSVEVYIGAVTEAAGRDTMSLKEKREREKQERVEEARQVQIRHEEAAEKVRKEIAETRREKFAAQRAQFTALKVQAEESRKHKESELKKRKREEEEIEAEGERRLEAERVAEEEDRRRVTEFYRRLEREAEDREIRAEWRIRRNNPAFKSRRILLQRETESTQETRLRRLEVTRPQTQPKETPSIASISDIEILQDAMGNFSAKFKDPEGNQVTDNLDFFEDFDSSLQNQITSRTFSELPDNVRNKVIHALEFRMVSKQNKNDPAVSLTKLTSLTPTPVPGGQSSIADFLRQDGGEEFQDWNGNVDDVDAPAAEVVGERKKSANLPIERVLYPHRYYEKQMEEMQTEETKIVLKNSSKPRPYTKSFPQLHIPVKQEATDPVAVLDRTDFPPLGLILENSVLVPLRAQKKLVDSALLDHLLVDCQLEEHFSALRRYLLLADGEFGRQLVVSLCQLGREIQEPAALAGQIKQHLTDGRPPPALLCPTALNRVLETAIAASLQGSSDPLARNLSFSLKENHDRNLGIPGLSLSYRATWPANIVLSEDILSKYSRVVDFMLNLRTCLVSLELDWAQENLVLRSVKKEVQPRLHKINIIRHEMLNFVRNLHSYVSTQVLEVSWMEFQENLTNKVSSLDDLINYHTKYLNRVLFRCLLNQKAGPVMKIINSIFVSINIFSSLNVGRFTGLSEEVWDQILKQYQTFKKTSKFLFGCVTKLASRGYQPHFQDLLMRLNFNGFYDTSLNASNVNSHSMLHS